MRIEEPRNEAERKAFIERLPQSVSAKLGSGNGRPILLSACDERTLVGRLAATPATNDAEAFMLLFLLAKPPAPQALWDTTHLSPDPVSVQNGLLAELETRVRSLGYRRLIMQPVFLVGTDQASLLLGSLRGQQWQEIRHVATRFHIGGYGLLKERWFAAQLPPGYEFFYWRDLTAEDREYVTSRRNASGFLDPFTIDYFDPETSLGLRNSSTGRVAGWFVNQPADATTVRFGRLYIFPEQRSKACFHPLVSQSVRYAWQHFERAVLAVTADNPGMRAALNRMLGRYCSLIVDSYYCEKVLYVSGRRTGC
jgi:hypothetical protein